MGWLLLCFGLVLDCRYVKGELGVLGSGGLIVVIVIGVGVGEELLQTDIGEKEEEGLS